MNRKVKVDVVTRRQGLFGLREVRKRRTITVTGKEYRKKGKWNREPSSEAERLAALYLMWEEDMAQGQEED